MMNGLAARLLFLWFCFLLSSITSAAEAPPVLVDVPAANDVTIVAADRVAEIYVSADDQTVVRICAGLLADDVERVTSRRPNVKTDAAPAGVTAILVGTIGQSALVDGLIARGTLDVTAVQGKWETFVIATVERPLPGVDRALVVAGSDRRGTAFGVLEISEQIGVSPWYWWADVAPKHHATLAVKAGTYVVGPPSVKYRGIFLNDEDWGLMPWAAHTFDPAFGNIGPKTYEKIFELMLRLKANYLWPAMHPVSTEFGTVPANIKLADDWAIVMGASHAEPMNRNNVHWAREGRGPYRYDTNRDGVFAYWEEAAKQRGPFEAVWTVGMRGIHDSGMQGPRDIGEQVKILTTVIDDQRSLLARYVNADLTRVPQAFMPYKEALGQYQAGLKLPDDVTLVWCDDNYGYIRQLSTPAEQRRAGGAGVYYHISYLGAPKSYLWLDTTPPALIWAEMQKALDHGADRIWVLNVGDLKSGELGMEFWTKLAWRRDRWGPNAQRAFLHEWAARDFGAAYADEITSIMDAYYTLGFQRKPELMSVGTFKEAYGEAANRRDAYRSLADRGATLGDRLPAEMRDAYFELVLYPVRMAAATNEAFLVADLSPERVDRAAAIADCVARVERETAHYNDVLAGGKWKGMITAKGMDFTGEYKGWASDSVLQWPTPTTRPSTRPASNGTRSVSDDRRMEADGSFAEIDGCVSMEAEHFSRSKPGADAHWQTISGLGRTGDAVTIRPASTASVADAKEIVAHAPCLEYDFNAATAGPARIMAYCLPTYRTREGGGSRYALSIDDAPPTIVDFDERGGASGDQGEPWRDRRRRNIAVGSTDASIAAGRHTLKLWMVDPGVIVDKLVIDLGGVVPSELGPPETRNMGDATSPR